MRKYMQSGQDSDQESMDVESKIAECSSTEKPKDTWQFNVMLYNTGWDPGTENGHYVKSKEI